MSTLQILFMLSAFMALGAGIPQMIKLIKTKNSDEFNLSTWAMWIVTQSISTAYVLSIHDYILLTVNVAWVAFYVAMSSLIVKYNPRRVLAVAQIQSDDAAEALSA